MEIRLKNSSFIDDIAPPPSASFLTSNKIEAQYREESMTSKTVLPPPRPQATRLVEGAGNLKFQKQFWLTVPCSSSNRTGKMAPETPAAVSYST